MFPVWALVSPPDCNEDGPLQLFQSDFFLLGEYLGCRGIVILFQDLPKAHRGVCYAVCVYV